MNSDDIILNTAIKAVFQSPRCAVAYKRLLESLDDNALKRCYNKPTPYMSQSHLNAIEEVLEARGISD